VDSKDLALLPHVMVHDSEQHSYGLVVPESEGCGADADAGEMIVHIKRRAGQQIMWSSEVLDVAAEISSMKAHLSAFPEVLAS
jgi:hypothetical protein